MQPPDGFDLSDVVQAGSCLVQVAQRVLGGAADNIRAPGRRKCPRASGLHHCPLLTALHPPSFGTFRALSSI